MSQINTFKKELEQEAVTTRKMLERIPDDKFGYTPHKKSMPVKQLAVHIAEMPGWINMTLDTSGLDFEKNPYKQEDINNTKDLLAYFEKVQKECIERLDKANDAEMDEQWTLSMGDTILSKSSKADMIRMSINQVVHHRAQLGVYLRLLDIPIPGSYGPSADEQMM